MSINVYIHICINMHIVFTNTCIYTCICSTCINRVFKFKILYVPKYPSPMKFAIDTHMRVLGTQIPP